MNTIKIIISLYAFKVWSLNQYGDKKAFLHELLNEELYVDLPPRYEYKSI